MQPQVAGEKRALLEACWDEVERFLGALSPELYGRGLLLKDDMATFLSSSGRLREAWTGDADFPLLQFHGWVRKQPGGEGPDAEPEHAIGCALVFSAAAAFLQESLLDQSSLRDASYGLLVNELVREADARLRSVLGDHPEFWIQHRRAWREYAEALLQQHRAENQAQQVLVIDPKAFAGKLAFGRLGMLAVVARSDDWHLWARVEPLIDDVFSCICALRAFGSLRADLARRRYNPLVAETAHAAGVDGRTEASYEAWLAALRLSGAGHRTAAKCTAQLERVRHALVELGLTEFARYAERLESRFSAIGRLIDGSAPIEVEVAGAAPIPGASEPALRAVVRMAEGYLLSDSTHRDAWEVQRRAVFETTEFVSRAFPTGLVLELLGRQSIDVSSAVDGVLSVLDANGYRYYEHPHLPPDSDDVALALRLLGHTKDQRWRESVRRPVRWIEANRLPTGEIPVWLTRQHAHQTRDSLRLWGNLCVSVEANLLRGLIAYDFDAFQGLITAASAALCARFGRLGLGANAHYVPLFALWTLAELHALLRDRFDGTEWKARLGQLHEDIRRCLSSQLRSVALTPQDAALALLASAALDSGKLDIAAARQWIAILCRTQRYDGSWAAEPLYGTPGRNEEATWYHSRSVTTAHCYHALKVYRQLSSRIE
jgi:hypothetical protein